LPQSRILLYLEKTSTNSLAGMPRAFPFEQEPVIHSDQQEQSRRRLAMEPGEKLVIIGCGGVGDPASVLSRKLMPEVEVTNVREEKRFIVR
jgi:hypothetical protein